MAYIGNTPGDKYLTLEKQVFTTSATDTYVLDREVSGVNEIELFLNNVRQEPTEAYTISGTTLTLASAITASDSMYCIYQGRSVGTQAPATGSVTNAMLAGSIATSKLADGSTFADNTKNYATWKLSSNQSTSTSADITNVTIVNSANITHSSGTFTITKAGLYSIFFNATFNTTSGGERQVGATIKINGTGVLGSRDQVTHLESGSSYGQCSVSVVQDLSVNDTINFEINQSYAEGNINAYADLTNGTIVRIV